MREVSTSCLFLWIFLFLSSPTGTTRARAQLTNAGASLHLDGKGGSSRGHRDGGRESGEPPEGGKKDEAESSSFFSRAAGGRFTPHMLPDIVVEEATPSTPPLSPSSSRDEEAFVLENLEGLEISASRSSDDIWLATKQREGGGKRREREEESSSRGALELSGTTLRPSPSEDRARDSRRHRRKEWSRRPSHQVEEDASTGAETQEARRSVMPGGGDEGEGGGIDEDSSYPQLLRDGLAGAIGWSRKAAKNVPKFVFDFFKKTTATVTDTAEKLGLMKRTPTLEDIVEEDSEEEDDAPSYSFSSKTMENLLAPGVTPALHYFNPLYHFYKDSFYYGEDDCSPASSNDARKAVTTSRADPGADDADRVGRQRNKKGNEDRQHRRDRAQAQMTLAVPSKTLGRSSSRSGRRGRRNKRRVSESPSRSRSLFRRRRIREDRREGMTAVSTNGRRRGPEEDDDSASETASVSFVWGYPFHPTACPSSRSSAVFLPSGSSVLGSVSSSPRSDLSEGGRLPPLPSPVAPFASSRRDQTEGGVEPTSSPDNPSRSPDGNMSEEEARVLRAGASSEARTPSPSPVIKEMAPGKQEKGSFSSVHPSEEGKRFESFVSLHDVAVLSDLSRFGEDRTFDELSFRQQRICDGLFHWRPLGGVKSPLESNLQCVWKTYARAFEKSLTPQYDKVMAHFYPEGRLYRTVDAVTRWYARRWGGGSHASSRHRHGQRRPHNLLAATAEEQQEEGPGNVRRGGEGEQRVDGHVDDTAQHLRKQERYNGDKEVTGSEGIVAAPQLEQENLVEEISRSREVVDEEEFVVAHLPDELEEDDSQSLPANNRGVRQHARQDHPHHQKDDKRGGGLFRRGTALLNATQRVLRSRLTTFVWALIQKVSDQVQRQKEDGLSPNIGKALTSVLEKEGPEVMDTAETAMLLGLGCTAHTYYSDLYAEGYDAPAPTPASWPAQPFFAWLLQSPANGELFLPRSIPDTFTVKVSHKLPLDETRGWRLALYEMWHTLWFMITEISRADFLWPWAKTKGVDTLFPWWIVARVGLHRVIEHRPVRYANGVWRFKNIDPDTMRLRHEDADPFELEPPPRTRSKTDGVAAAGLVVGSSEEDSPWAFMAEGVYADFENSGRDGRSGRTKKKTFHYRYGGRTLTIHADRCGEDATFDYYFETPFTALMTPHDLASRVASDFKEEQAEKEGGGGGRAEGGGSSPTPGDLHGRRQQPRHSRIKAGLLTPGDPVHAAWVSKPTTLPKMWLINRTSHPLEREPTLSDNPHAKVHRGFRILYQTSFLPRIQEFISSITSPPDPKVLEKVREEASPDIHPMDALRVAYAYRSRSTPFTVLFAGHSQGGAQSQMAALYFAKQLRKSIDDGTLRVIAVCFGAPSWGTPEMYEELSNSGVILNDLSGSMDPVPYLMAKQQGLGDNRKLITLEARELHEVRFTEPFAFDGRMWKEPRETNKRKVKIIGASLGVAALLDSTLGVGATHTTFYYASLGLMSQRYPFIGWASYLGWPLVPPGLRISAVLPDGMRGLRIGFRSLLAGEGLPPPESRKPSSSSFASPGGFVSLLKKWGSFGGRPGGSSDEGAGPSRRHTSVTADFEDDPSSPSANGSSALTVSEGKRSRHSGVRGRAGQQNQGKEDDEDSSEEGWKWSDNTGEDDEDLGYFSM